MRRRVFLGGQAVSLVGDGLAVLAVPLLVLQVTRSPVAVGLAAAARTVGYLAVGLPAGAVVDRVDPWRLMLAMDVVRAGAFGAMYVVTGLNGGSVGIVLGLAFVAGGAGVFFESALMVAIKDVFAPGALVRVNALLELATQVARVAGPGVVGVLAVTAGVRPAVLVNAATFAVSLATLYAVRPARRTPQHEGRNLRRELAEGVRYILNTRVLLTMTLLQVVINFALGSEKLVVFLLKDTLGLATWTVSAVVVAGGAGGILGALAAPRLAARLGDVRAIIGGIVVTGAAFAVLGVTGAAGVAAAYALMLAAQTAAGVVNRSMRLRIVPHALTGRVFSTTRLAFGGVDPAGAAVAGALTGILGGDPRPVFAVAGVIVVLAAAVARLTGLRPGDDAPG